MRHAFRGLLTVLVALAAVPRAEGANVRGQVCNCLRQISLALIDCQMSEHVGPSDIRDAGGRPLLSWRVRILPYLEEGTLFNEFHLDEPWDGPHNRALVGRMPKVYWNPYSPREDGRVRFLAAGPAGGGRGPVPFAVAEVDDEHAVPWTKPEDLPYDPEQPARGLDRRFGAGDFNRRGGLVAFADGSIRLVPRDADAGQLRALFAGDAGPGQFSRPWYAALREWPLGFVIAVWLVVTLAPVAGGAVVLWRLARGLPVTPGEMLWLVAGAGGLAHAAAVTVWYRYEAFPAPPGKRDDVRLWFLPAVALALAAGAAAVRFPGRGVWHGYFLAACVALGVIALDSGSSHQHREPEESFGSAVSPITLALVAATGVGLSLAFPETIPPGRLRTHWIGLTVCLLPFAWFLFCCWWGWTRPRPLFVRVLD